MNARRLVFLALLALAVPLLAARAEEPFPVVPTVRQAAEPVRDAPLLTVALPRSGEVRSDGQAVDVDGIAGLVRARLSDKAFATSGVVLIAAAVSVPWPEVAGVLGACRDAGAPRIFFAVKKKEGGEGSVDASPRKDAVPGPTLLDVVAKSRPRDIDSRYRLGDLDCGLGGEGLAALEQAVGKELARSAGAKVAALVRGEGRVPFNDVLMAADAVRCAGVADVRFAAPSAGGGAKPPRPAEPPPPAEPPARAPAGLAGRSVGDIVLGLKPAVRRGLRVYPARPDPETEPIELARSSAGTLLREDLPAVEIEIARNGDVRCAGERPTFEELRMLLFVYAEVARDESSPTQPAKTAAVLVVDARARWREVQWVMMTCADPAVRMNRVYWVVADDAGKASFLDASLPTDRGLTRGEKPPCLEVELTRRQDDASTTVTLLDRETGADAEGIDALGPLAKSMLAGDARLSVQLNAWAWVPFGQVVRTVGVLRAAGVSRTDFVGAPPPTK